MKPMNRWNPPTDISSLVACLKRSLKPGPCSMVRHSKQYVHTVLKDNSTMDKTDAQIVSYGILYLNPSSHQCQPSYKKYIPV